MKTQLIKLTLLTLVLLNSVTITAGQGIGVCNWPTVAEGSETTRNIYCPEEPNIQTPDTYGTCSTDVVYWPQPQGQRTVRACAIPVFCGRTTWIERFWSTTQMQTGQNVYTYWSRWNVRAGYINSPNTDRVTMDYQYTEDCMRSSPTPIAINFGAGADLDMTDPRQNCTMFQLEGAGTPHLCLGWLKPNSNQAWLVFDRNANGQIDDGSELFGDRTEPQAAPIGDEARNGYRALRAEDTNGNGMIDAGDAAYWSLKLWFDRNSNGQADAGELLPFSYYINTFSLDYKKVGKRDQFGNGHTLRSELTLINGDKRFSYDVYPVSDSDKNEHINVDFKTF